jgi:hypothetical protein
MWTWLVHHKGWQRGVADDHCAGSMNHGEGSVAKAGLENKAGSQR